MLSDCQEYVYYNNYMSVSRVAQWECAGPITQRVIDQIHPLLAVIHHSFTV